MESPTGETIQNQKQAFSAVAAKRRSQIKESVTNPEISLHKHLQNQWGLKINPRSQIGETDEEY